MGYKIGSFNMFKFSVNESSEEIKKDLKTIAKIICIEKFDIIAMQEVLNEKSMSMLLDVMNQCDGGTKKEKKWKGTWDTPKARTTQAAEGYAFIWNTERIQLAKSVTASGERIYYPRIYKQYRIDRSAGQRDLLRDPYYGRFKPIGMECEIRIINTHVRFSKEKVSEANNIALSISEHAMRKNEYDILIKNILAKENTWRYGNNLPAYTILLGDYNLNLNRAWTTSPYLQEIVEIVDGKHSYVIRTSQDQLTTLRSRSPKNPDEPVRGYANNYDHFSYDEERFAALGIRIKRIDSVRKYCKDDFEKHRREVSDHIPISMQFTMKEEK